MSDFNFNIDSGATFLYGADRRSTRDLLKFTEAKRRWKGVAPDTIAAPAVSHRSVVPQNRLSPSRRSRDTQQATVNRGAAQGEHSTYRNFKISTARPSHSICVAYFERLDGRPILWQGTARSIVRTASYGSEVLAIADAQISIDDLMASQPAALPGA